MSYQICIDKDYGERCQRYNDDQIEKRYENDKETLNDDKESDKRGKIDRVDKNEYDEIIQIQKDKQMK